MWFSEELYTSDREEQQNSPPSCSEEKGKESEVTSFEVIMTGKMFCINLHNYLKITHSSPTTMYGVNFYTLILRSTLHNMSV